MKHTDNLNNQVVIQDASSNYIESDKTEKIPKRKIYKKNLMYTKAVSFWPEIFGTSSLSANKNFVKNFFKSISEPTFPFIKFPFFSIEI